jgi:hypothetical protein
MMDAAAASSYRIVAVDGLLVATFDGEVEAAIYDAEECSLVLVELQDDASVPLSSVRIA